MTGTHSLKVGFLDTFGTRREDYTNIDANVRYRFNNGVPNLITQIATPYGFRSNLGGELGIFAQDRWMLYWLTLNLGVRFDYLNINFPEQFLGTGAARAQPKHHVSPKRLPGLQGYLPTGRRGLRSVRQRQDRPQGQPGPVPCAASDSNCTNLGNPVSGSPPR